MTFFCRRIFANNQLSACLPGFFSLPQSQPQLCKQRLWCRKLRLTGAATETTGTTLCLLLLLLLGSKALLTDWQHKLWELAWCYLLTVGSTYVPTFRCLGSCGRGEVRWSPRVCVTVLERPQLLQTAPTEAAAAGSWWTSVLTWSSSTQCACAALL